MLRQAQRERGGAVHRLRCHPLTPANTVTAVEVGWLTGEADTVSLGFAVTGADALVLPEPALPGRADELWRTTCFEMFWHPAGAEGYVEMNFSPSGRWAAYAFDGYRLGMRPHSMAVDPVIALRRDGDRLIGEVAVDLSTLPREAAFVGLFAVIEETDGTKSYWALAHPPGRPDFHHADCFALELPAIPAA